MRMKAKARPGKTREWRLDIRVVGAAQCRSKAGMHHYGDISERELRDLREQGERNGERTVWVHYSNVVNMHKVVWSTGDDGRRVNLVVVQ